MAPIPRKLKVDTIAEAICEVRFDCRESSQLPELVVGKLASRDPWVAFDKIRLPVSELPASLRAQDLSLKFQPAIELREPSGHLIVKIGVNVLSVHRIAPYPGGDAFEAEIDDDLKFLFSSFDDLRVERLGLRYINIFTEQEHGVKSVLDLYQSVSLAGTLLITPFNLNYIKMHGAEHKALIKIATPEFVAGPLSKPFHALVDVDVFTPDGFACADASHARRWISRAREYEKQEFFSLFTPEMTTRLVETY